jgi:hypothetical protein
MNNDFPELVGEYDRTYLPLQAARAMAKAAEQRVLALAKELAAAKEEAIAALEHVAQREQAHKDFLECRAEAFSAC